MRRTILTAAALAVTLALSGDSAIAQFRQASPDGSAATQVRGKYVGGGDEPRYEGGKWIEITVGLIDMPYGAIAVAPIDIR